MFIRICSSQPDFKKRHYHSKDNFEEKEINTRELKNALGKLYVTFTESNIAYLVLKENNSFIYKEEKKFKDFIQITLFF